MLQMRDVQVQDAPRQETQTQTEPSSPSAQAVANQPSDQAWWQSLPDRATGWATAWFSDASRVVLSELGDLVSIRKASDPQALLLSEQQAMQLRANVRSMLLSAQLALMTRQSTIWRSELSEIEALLNTQYEPQSVDTKAALRLVRELLAKPVSVELPALTDSLSALEAAVRALSVPAAGAQ
jgi:uroporphyrin-3 C-methyltransferase